MCSSRRGTYQVEWVFDQLINIDANRTDLVDEVIYSDPDTGERLRAHDFTAVFGGEILRDDEPVPFVGGMSSFAVNENGIWATSHSSRSTHVLRADHDGKEIWVNANGDGWDRHHLVGPRRRPGDGCGNDHR